MTVLVGNLSFQSVTNHYERPCILRSKTYGPPCKPMPGFEPTTIMFHLISP